MAVRFAVDVAETGGQAVVVVSCEVDLAADDELWDAMDPVVIAGQAVTVGCSGSHSSTLPG
ncbi:hypothetical protein [Catenulispora pinisilvae]|uniref:hypothetical protein n=1 Tax=Catenulispora pinisilvae TaxID=2705253 RepID=UPI001892424C|nr:hypothetical protein [Catenulispora pinisilvae]